MQFHKTITFGQAERMASPAALAALGANVMNAPVHLQFPKAEGQVAEGAPGSHGSGVPPGTGGAATDVGKRKPRKGANGDADAAAAAKPKPRKILV